jgi:branched-chain amino acid transport system ATP-binding protein
MSLLAVDGLNSYYGDSHILFDVSMRVEANEVVALLGRNGAGKTTTLRSLMGVVTPRSGTIQLEGEAIQGLPPFVIARRGVQLVPEDRRIFGSLNVEENLELASITAPGRWPLARIYEIFPHLAERRRSRGTDLSGGEQQMLTIARALIRGPKIILLDEPFEGLAPVIIDTLAAALVRLRRESRIATLLVEQQVDIALEMTERTIVLDKGQIVYRGASAALAADRDRLGVLVGLQEDEASR